MHAADTAARWHVHQRRKGIAQEPYINHLLEVASLVAEATGGTDPKLVIAAFVHDAIEDQGVTSEMLASEFGQHVADIVIGGCSQKEPRGQADQAGRQDQQPSHHCLKPCRRLVG